MIASPFMILIALAIKLYDGGPVFYKQPRLTKDKQIFYDPEIQKHENWTLK